MEGNKKLRRLSNNAHGEEGDSFQEDLLTYMMEKEDLRVNTASEPGIGSLENTNAGPHPVCAAGASCEHEGELFTRPSMLLRPTCTTSTLPHLIATLPYPLSP